MGLLVIMHLLETVPCPDCGGDGYQEDHTGADRCETCYGCGLVEVCGGCNEMPRVVDGYDTCGCYDEEGNPVDPDAFDEGPEDLPAIIQDEFNRGFWGDAA